MNCGWGGKGRAGVLAIKEGIDYLQGIDGYCGLDDGPYKCARVSCSWDSAIWLCNDNDTPLRVPCKDLGPFAAKIREGCMSSGWSEPMTQGTPRRRTLYDIKANARPRPALQRPGQLECDCWQGQLLNK